MNINALNPSSCRFEFLKWVSEKNRQVPISELEFMLDIQTHGEDDDDTKYDDTLLSLKAE